MGVGLVAGIVQILVMIIAEYLKWRSSTEQDSKDYIQFVEIMDRKGLASVGMRIKAIHQTERVSGMWRDEEKREQENEGTH